MKQALTNRGALVRGWNLLNELLLIALNRAVPLDEVDDLTVLVGQDLQFHVRGLVNEFLPQNGGIAER